MEILSMFTNDITILLGMTGMLAFVVSVITETTKNIGFLKRIPTDLQVIVLSILLSVFVYLTYVSYYQITLKWFYVVGSIVGGFIVAFVAMYGWEKIITLYGRFKQ